MAGLCAGKIYFLHKLGNRKSLFLMLFILNSMVFIYFKCQELTTTKIRIKKKLITTKSSFYSSTVKNSITAKRLRNLKYILQWHPDLVDVNEGQKAFAEALCKYSNCYLTNKKDYFEYYTEFDAIVFSGPDAIKTSNRHMPQLRASHQKYVFFSAESSGYYPVCSDRFDGYFNWTWTFRLDSDISMAYIVIRDSNANIIGPKTEMHWMKLEDMDPVSQDVREKLKTKHKFAAWLVSNCYSKDDREKFVQKLNKELKIQGHDYEVDIYGLCGDKKCPPHMYCEHMFEQDYYFYLAFENSFNHDYVTEKLLRALEFYTIPVVYGGANYTRFMPDGIYLNAGDLGVKKLAAKMVEIANDFEQFAGFFKWKKYYSYSTRSASPDSNNYCAFCALLNNENEQRKITIKKKFQEWWDPPDAKC